MDPRFRGGDDLAPVFSGPGVTPARCQSGAVGVHRCDTPGPEPGDDRVYQLWYIDADGATSAGTFAPASGDAYVVLDGAFEPGLVVGITVEPEGGSEAPTTEPIVVFET